MLSLRLARIKSSNEIAKFVVENIIYTYARLKTILSDQGLEFFNKYIDDILFIPETKHSLSSVYRPLFNGAVEMQNQTLVGKLF